MDVDRIAREVDFQALQANIVNITFCNVDLEVYMHVVCVATMFTTKHTMISKEFHNVDTNFVKMFRLAQLIIEYLLVCHII